MGTCINKAIITFLNKNRSILEIFIELERKNLQRLKHDKMKY